jgi:transposase
MPVKTKIEDLATEDIRDFLKTVKKTHFYKRIQFIHCKKEGMTHEKIALLLHVCLKTLTNWMNLFSEKGIEGLISVSYDRRTSKLCSIEKALREKVKAGEVSTAALCREWIKKEQKISVSLSTVGWFLKKNGIVFQENQARTRRYA